MKKVLIIIASSFLLACAKPVESTPVPSQTPVSTAIATAQPTPQATAMATPETSVIEAVIIEELPQSLKIAIQDMEVNVAKGLDYECDSPLVQGDTVDLYYTGTLEENPQVIKAEKK